MGKANLVNFYSQKKFRPPSAPSSGAAGAHRHVFDIRAPLFPYHNISKLHMVHKCNYCTYTSEKLYNIKRHTIRRHNTIDDSGENEGAPNAQMVAKITPNVVKITPNVVNSTPNVVNGAPNVVKNNCHQCGKAFVRKYNLDRHISSNRCKGANTLQCHICLTMFQNRFAKYYHIKKGTCSPPAKLEAASETTAEPQKNITNITNNNNNNITNNNITNITNNTNNIDMSQNIHINYINYNTSNNDPIEFRTDHMDDPKILRAIFAKEGFCDMFADFTDAILAAPENNIVKKTNLSRDVTKVYIVERGLWEQLLDQQVFHKIARGVSTSALTLSDKHKKKARLMPVHKSYLSDIAVECEVPPCAGYEDDELRYSKITRDAIRTVKIRSHAASVGGAVGNKQA